MDIDDHDGHEFDPDHVGAVERFPGSNPHPVMRVADDGRLSYANPASGVLLETLGVSVGEEVPEAWGVRLREAAASGTSLELGVGARTFELLPVRLEDLGVTNVYGTDVTAQKAIVKFPDQNPNPVFRLTWDGTLVYANLASSSLIEGLDASVGRPFPAEIGSQLISRAVQATRDTVEVDSNGRRYSLLPVDVPEFGFINVYGTDVTAARELEAVHRENERLLLNILPEPIADRLRQGERVIADRFDDVSLLFADVVEFTRLSSAMSADEVVAILNELFTVFDGLVDEAGLEKVKTIGDAYMIVGGMTDRSEDHLDRVARMALTLAERLDELEAANRRGIRFRIGIHAGPVVAGVIGTRKFIYDIWGDTVNIASRMESSGAPGRVHVSGAVEQRLRDRFVFETRGLIDIKGKGQMATFFLVGEVDAIRRASSR